MTWTHPTYCGLTVPKRLHGILMEQAHPPGHRLDADAFLDQAGGDGVPARMGTGAVNPGLGIKSLEHRLEAFRMRW